jgi:hypothetical protein
MISNGRYAPRWGDSAMYLPEGIDPARVRKFFNDRPPNITTLDQFKAARQRR